MLTAARRRLVDAARHKQVIAAAAPSLLAIADEAQTMLSAGTAFPDERLKLLFVCAHPAIDVAVHTPLMLQTVLHLDAGRIASVFLMKPSAMGQRLSRAKAKIRDARIPFDVPERADLPLRLDAVLEAIYAAYGRGWEDAAGIDPKCKGLSLEAIDLGRLLIRLMPDEPEPKGLLALMLHCEARRKARRSGAGNYVPLSEQKTSLWSAPMMAEAEDLLASAARMRVTGRFQLEAAIQSVHARRAGSGTTDWEAISLLYEGLVRHAPTIGALVGRAAAVGEAHGALSGVHLLDTIPARAIQTYQPYWALRAHLFKCLNNFEEARAALDRAIGLCEDEAIRAFLLNSMPRRGGSLFTV